MAIKTLRVFAEFTSTGFVPMPTAAGIDYGFTVANTYPATQPSTFQTDNPDLVVTVTAQTDFYVWIRLSGTAWNPSYTRNVRVYPDSPDINSVVMNMIIATGPAGVSSYTQIVQTANRLYFNGATTDSTYNSKFAGKTYINELNFGTAPQLATVATSGAYADLTGKPALATVATSGSYADLSSKPSGTAPISYNSGTNSFQITQANTSTNGFLTSTDWNTFNNKYLLPSGGTTTQYLRGDGTLATFPTTLDSTRLILNGRNSTGTTLTKGTVVYINGVQGNTPLFARALATGDSTSAQTVGIVEFDIANNATGVVVVTGLVGNLDTSSYTEGVQLYLSGTTAGAFTSSKLTAPTHLVYVGIVTRAHPTQGSIEVKIQNGYELYEIHDVAITSVADKDIIYRDVATNLWKNASVSNVLGFTPYNATNPSNFIARTGLSASAPLLYNNTTGAFSIAQANGSTNGFLSSTDWTTFNSKQSALTLGNVSEVSSNVLMFPDGGTGKTIGNLSIQVVQASASTNGYLSSTDWSTFNSKQSALTLGNVTESVSNVLMFPDGGTNKTVGNLSIQVVQAGSTTNGFLSTTDWNTFNNKQNAITLTTTGTSGASTFSGGTLNIPQYQAVLTNPVTGTGTTNFVTKWTSSSAIGNSTIREVSGNVGLGVTPSAWGSNYFPLQTQGGALWSFNSTLIDVWQNAFFNGTSSIYLTTAQASYYRQTEGIHQWFTAPSGTAGNAVTFTQRMTLTQAGNVGIGTSSPSQLLEVNGSSETLGISMNIRNSFDGADSTKYSGINFLMGSDNGTSAIRAYRTNSAADFQTNLTFWTKGAGTVATSPTERMQITSGGAIIGTNDSQFRVTRGGNFRVNSNSNGLIGYLIRSGSWKGNSEDNISLATDGPYGISFFTNGSGSERVLITAGGNILMGTASDNGERLYVSGSIRATGNITANSDLTLKKNLQLIENPAEKLMSLNGYSYQWKENDEYQYGVIAQEVEKVMSYAVQTGNNGIKGVAYNQLTPLLIEGFKLHNSEITQLKERVKYLEAKLA